MKLVAVILIALLLGPLSAYADVRVETVMMPMRDGIPLATDIYRGDATTVAPVVLMRTPYNKDRAKGAAERFAAQIAPGHQLRVDICGAYFPLFDRNPNTAEGPFGKSTAIATESVYHTSAKPSRILLPVSASNI